MNNTTQKKEHLRLQTLVNRISSDDDIAREYYNLVTFIVENYPMRMETIQAPLLHLISHCIEISCKTALKASEKAELISIEINWGDISHSHELEKISKYVIALYHQIVQVFPIDESDEYLMNFATNLSLLCEMLKTNTTAYRYAYNMRSNGEYEKKSLPFEKDSESPNIGTVYNLFSDCYMALSYMRMMLSNLLCESVDVSTEFSTYLSEPLVD